MREVAEEVRKKFGLETFSHSTISRALKKLIQQFNTHQEQISLMFLKNTAIEPVHRKNRDASFHQRAGTLLKILFPVLTQTISYGCLLAYLFYLHTCQFIL
jgi:hypothetical protein